MIHFFAELIGRNIKIIVDQCRCTGLRLRIVEMRVRLYPRIQNCKIFAHDLPIAGKHFIAVPQGDGGDGVIKNTAANEVIIPVREEGFQRRLIMGGDPAHAESRK